MQRPVTTTTTTTKRPTTITTTTTTITTTGKPCSHGQYYAVPDSCTQFLICVNDNLVKQQCGPGLNWNDAKKMCDWAFMNPCKDAPKKTSALMMKEMDSLNVSHDLSFIVSPLVILVKKKKITERNSK